MSSDFKIGDKVQVLDDLISGEIVRTRGTMFWILTEDGFELPFAASELIRIEAGSTMQVTRQEAVRSKQEKDVVRKKKEISTRGKARYTPQMEVDLHAEKLENLHRNAMPSEVLDLQIETAKRQLEFAIRKGIQKVVFIHGVGEGILKKELEYLFGRYPEVQYYEADYRKYGMGATEIFIRQNP